MTTKKKDQMVSLEIPWSKNCSANLIYLITNSNIKYSVISPHRKKLIQRAFMENEAELSGSEFDSDENYDAEEFGDELEVDKEADEEDLGDEEQLRSQLNKVHM